MRLPLFVVPVVVFTALVSCDRMRAHGTGAHHGVPSRIIAGQRAGPYVASVWTDPDVGVGTIYVVVNAANDLAFTPPSVVRVGVAPVSGRLPEVVHEVHGEPGGRGARFMTEVAFDRAERWNVRILITGPGGGGQLLSQVEAKPNAMLGPFGLLLSSVPFVLVAAVWWRATAARRSRVEVRVDR